ncbi:tetratricopeptide repeat protein [Thalassobaculum sp.]|uniref:tetratricopeptide repeat protein n=1 Tax=Thalassobaculum sp. TaxID=2022740 RepID=UPI0032EBE162
MPKPVPLPPPVIAAFRLYQTDQPEAAFAALLEAGSGALGHPAGQLLLGAVLLDRNDPRQAADAFRRAMLLDPGYGRACVNASVVLRRLNRLEQALRAANWSVCVDPVSHTARNARSAVLLDLDRPGGAVVDAQVVLAGAPDDAEALLNRGVALQRLGDFTEASSVLEMAVRHQPNDPAARHARSYLRLLQGDLPDGWREREARWALPGHAPLLRLVGVPLWTGEPLSGRTIAVFGDEGRGDMIQYVRFLRQPPFDEARVTLCVPSYMVRLFAGALSGVDVIASPPTGRMDFQIPLSRIPSVLGTDIGTIPASVPYLPVEPERLEHWRSRIGDHGLRVAICWQGNPGTPVDRGRSIPLASFAPLAVVPGVRLIALQARHGVDQLANLPDGMTVEVLGPGFDSGPDSFVDPAAVVQAVDLVISSDTALAHLAGALGRPVWLALRRVPDFRWLLGRDDSPWYPTMRLFRQSREGDWDEVVGRMVEALRDYR